MFEIVLTISVILILIAVSLYRVHPAAVVFVFAIAFVVSIPFFAFTAKPLFFIYPALLVAWTVCRRFDARRVVFAACASLSIGGVWIIAMLLFLPRWKEIQRLDAEYPVVRMDERLAYERKLPQQDDQESNRVTRASLPSEAELEEITGIHYPWHDYRGSALASLERTHDSFVNAFTEQEEFGFFRMYHMPATAVTIRLPEPRVFSLPEPPLESVSARDNQDDELRPAEHPQPLEDFHRDQALAFVNPKGFGYPLDGEWESMRGRAGATRVRGFQPHAFSDPPAPPTEDDWQLTNLELVSLLKHEPPAVYVSDHLPRMQDLSSDAPTRSLDRFESASLKRLLDGETVVAAEGRDRLRMFGGLRAAQQCRQCHTVGKGDLLGAFTYEFRRKIALPPGQKGRRQDPKPLL